MTPEERAEQLVADMSTTFPRARVVSVLAKRFADAIAEEREACAAIVRKFLLFDSQRAVSWHEVQDVLDAIRART